MIGRSTPTSRGDLRRVHAGGVDDDVALDAALVRLDRDDAAVARLDAGHGRPHLDLRAEPPRRVGERERQLARVEIAVVGDVGGREHAVGAHRREQRLRLLRRDDLHRQPERLRPRRLAADLLEPRLRRREPQAAELAPAGVVPRQLLQLGVEPDRVLHHPRQRQRRAQLADEPGRVPRRAVRQLVLLEEERIRPALLREVVEDGAADHAAADHHRPCPFRDHGPVSNHRRIARWRSKTSWRRFRSCATRTTVEPLTGGLTNTNYKVTTAQRRVRRPHLRQGHRPARDRPRQRDPQHDRRLGDRRRRAVRRRPAGARRARARVHGRRDDDAGAAAPRRPARSDRRRRAGGSTRAGGSSTTSTCSRSSAATSTSCASAASGLPDALRRVRAAGACARGGDARPPRADRAVQQRPARRELHRRRRRAAADRLRVLRQQRAVVRARQRLERVGPLARPARGARRRVLRTAAAQQGRPRARSGA